MSAGPLFPFSPVFVTSGKVGPAVHTGAASTGVRRTRGIQVIASLDANADVELMWKCPPALPTGTCKLHLDMRTTGTGNAKIQIDWVSVAVGEDPSAATLLSESLSTVAVVGWDSDKFIQLKKTLVADTIVAGEFLCMRLRFVTASWTLNQPLLVVPSLVWE